MKFLEWFFKEETKNKEQEKVDALCVQIKEIFDEKIKYDGYWKLRSHIEGIVSSEIIRRIDEFRFNNPEYKETIKKKAIEHLDLHFSSDAFSKKFDQTISDLISGVGYSEIYNDTLKEGFRELIKERTAKILGTK